MIKMKKLSIFLVLALLLVSVTAAMAEEPSYTEDWDGRGTDSEHCEYAGQEGRPATGWIHWVFSTKGDSTDALLTLGGTGSGAFSPGAPFDAEVWHFYTPYFPLEGLTASIELFGGDKGPGGGLVISDYCPGKFEKLEVKKTAKTSFTREHFWDIAKKVETEKGYTKDGYPKIWLYTDGSGNEKATWTVDVTYKGFEDKDFKVFGKIYIKNTGTLDAVINSVEDVLAGTPISVDCGVTFPYTLPVGATLECSYSEDGFVEGYNKVFVTTKVKTYQAKAPIVWGKPTKEINKTVTVKDISDLFGEVELGTVTAPDNAKFTYSKYFAWKNYGKDACGSYLYKNTATIVETKQSASAALKVNVQCFVYETAYAKGGSAVCFIPTFKNWGWTNPITKGEYVWPLWAGAAQCDTSKGTNVGSVSVQFNSNGYVTVNYNVAAPYILAEKHVYAGYDMFPKDRRGNYTVAPGLYTNGSPFASSPVYVIAHAVVGMPDPNFGP
jgi:hypothetical protein